MNFKQVLCSVACKKGRMPIPSGCVRKHSFGYFQCPSSYCRSVCCHHHCICVAM